MNGRRVSLECDARLFFNGGNGDEDFVGNRPQSRGHGCHHVQWHYRGQIRRASVEITGL